MSIWLSDARLVLPERVIERGSLRIEDGRIAEIVEDVVPGAVYRLHGMTLIPGIIDMHGDMIEREIEPRPSVHLPYDMALSELDKRLVASGVTTAYAAISFSEIFAKRGLRTEERARDLISNLFGCRDELLVDLRVHARFEVVNVEAPPVLMSLIAAEQVHLVSLNDHTPGQGQYRDVEKYIKTMAEWRNQTTDQIATVTMDRIKRAQATPPAWDIVREVTRIAAEHHLPIASHDDDTPDKVALMDSLGVTISEFPVTAEAAEAAKARGMKVVMGAPNAMRGKSHSGNLSAQDAIAAGLVDFLAADYSPGTLIQSVLLIAGRGLLSLPKAIALITRNPALALGLPDRGALTPGFSADLAVVDMSGARPRVRGTFREGRPVYLDGRILG